MFLQSYVATLCLVFCIAVCDASSVLEAGIREAFLAKYRLIQGPSIRLKTFCEAEKKRGVFSCGVSYQWTQDGVLQEVCETPKERWFYPPRYYNIVLECKFRGVSIKGLRSQWTVFY